MSLKTPILLNNISSANTDKFQSLRNENRLRIYSLNAQRRPHGSHALHMTVPMSFSPTNTLTQTNNSCRTGLTHSIEGCNK